MIDANRFAKLETLIANSNDIVIFGHTGPDPDSLGSSLGLAHLLQNVYPEKIITCALADPHPVPEKMEFLPGANEVFYSINWDFTIDFCAGHMGRYDKNNIPLVIFVDSNIKSRWGEVGSSFWSFAKEDEDDFDVDLDKVAIFAAIDHHPVTPEKDLDFAFTDASAPSCSTILTEWAIQSFPQALTPNVATCFYAGLIGDTGNFAFASATPRAFDCAANLAAYGADISLCAEKLFIKKSKSLIQMEAICDLKTEFLENGKVAWCEVEEKDFRGIEDTDDVGGGMVDHLKQFDGPSIQIYIRYLPNDFAKGSIRSDGIISANKLAQQMGGGGHKVAAGFKVFDPNRTSGEKLKKLLHAALLQSEKFEPRFAQ